MRRRTCVCGAEIPWNRSLCRRCREEYGPDREQWPEWLRFYVADVQRELDTERLHRDLELLDDFPIDDRYPSERPDPVRAAWEEIASWEDDGDG